MSMRVRTWMGPCLIALGLLAPADARGEEDAGAGTCIEKLPEGASRPLVEEKFPPRGQSGFAATLEVTLQHGKGETVLPSGLEIKEGSDAARELHTRHFALPHQDGGGAAKIMRESGGADGRAKTKVEITFVPLNKDPGRHVLVLPSLPLAVGRASGEVIVVCTKPHRIVVDDPTASTPDAKPKDNPAPRPQREEWTALRRAVEWGLVGALLALLVAYGLRAWISRPKAIPPPPPPRPPWEIALLALHEVRHAGLLEAGRLGEFFDRVNDIVRNYLGGRFGFDGLESTSHEIMVAMQKVQHFGLGLDEIRVFLDDTDLVKYANVTPSTADCTRALEQAERVVQATMPQGAGSEARTP